MSLTAQAQMTEDNGLIVRIAAAAALCGVSEARIWAVNNIWSLSASPGWAEAYAEASEDDPEVEPAAWYGIHGSDPTVITDSMIVDAVTALIDSQKEA